LAGLRHGHGTATTATRVGRLLLSTLALGASLALLGAGATAGATGRSSAGGFLSVNQPQVATTLATLPANFQESIVFSGLDRPTAVRFANDGRVFVAEKRGVVKVFDNLSDTTPTVFADLRTNVHDFWDRGMLGLALDPNFPTAPYLYVSYTYDAPPGQSAPVWNDACPTPPGATTDGCVVTGRLSRLTASGNVMTGSEQVLLSGWCQQFPSHSVGDLRFGADGALYVSGGDGASFNNVDYGQYGGSPGSPTPKNPCGDPPAGVGGT
jgi:glucose/arabinose dehydrogenase